MEAGFKCHKCKSTYEEYLILKCSREKCNNYFCLFCFREKYKKNYMIKFRKKLNEWINREKIYW